MITARGLEGKARRELDATRSSEKVLAEEKMVYWCNSAGC